MCRSDVWNFPWWPDAGRPVVIKDADGGTLEGVLYVEDSYYDGEGEEIPIFCVSDAQDVNHPFDVLSDWHYADKIESVDPKI